MSLRSNPVQVTKEETERLESLRQETEAGLELLRRGLIEATRRDRLFMSLRLISFAVFFSFFMAAAVTQNSDVAVGILPGLLLFLTVLRVHKPHRVRLRTLQARQKLLKARRGRINSVECERKIPAALDAVRRALSTADERGERPDRSVLNELGVYEKKRGLLALIDTTQTALGSWAVERALSGELRSAETILADQNATRELLANRPFRLSVEEDYHLAGRSGERAAAAFLADSLPDRQASAPLLAVLPFTVGTLALGVASVHFESLLMAVGATLLAGLGNFIHRRGLKTTALIRNGTAECEGYLHLLIQLDDRLSDSGFTSSVLTSTGAALSKLRGDETASPRRGLRLLGWLGIYRAGLFYVFFNFLTLYDLYFTRPLLDFWHDSRDDIVENLRLVAGLEALLALANTAEEQAGMVFPTIEESDIPRLSVTQARHPVLDTENAVPMSIDLGAKADTFVVTGANMAGKSTLIRTLGASVLIGGAGGAIPATAAIMTPLLLCSDINVTDSLVGGESTFGAEAKRVAAIAATVQRVSHTLVLLDEVFRGTNTHEKVAAGRALVEWLSRQRALTVAATHDHELTALASTEGAGIRNVHFNAECSEGHLVFDYILREGPAPGTNALQVLAAAGLPQEVVDEAISQLPSRPEPS